MLFFEQHRTLEINDWIKDHYKGEPIFIYNGCVNSEIISKCIETLENYLKKHKPISNPKKAVNIAIELLQNIYHHGLPLNGTDKYGVVKIIQLNNGLQMEFLNLINKDKAILLYERIQQLNVLSKDEIKRLHLLILSNNEYSQKGGGGLGLVDVAKKLNKKLIAEFYPYIKNNYFYLLKILVN